MGINQRERADEYPLSEVKAIIAWSYRNVR
jgi:hypothetical protein